MDRTPLSSSTYHDEALSFLTGENALYVAGIYAQYKKDAASVDLKWQHYFAALHDDEQAILQDVWGPSWARREVQTPEPKTPQISLPSSLDENSVKQAILDSVRLLMMIRAYRARGYLMANLDPLGLQERPPMPELDPKTYGFTEDDMSRPIFIDGVLGFESATVSQVLSKLRSAYGGTIGVEFIHIQDPDKKLWLQKRIEGDGERDIGDPITDPKRLETILTDLVKAESFEKFLHVKYPAAKRFGLDGGESLVPGLLRLIARSAEVGVKEAVIGMAHRGRLNVLANIMQKPYRAIFAEFQGGAAKPDDVQGSGDVKYHLGASTDRDFDGNTIHLSLCPNPSHLEAVDPIVVGRVRAKQDLIDDHERSQVMGILLHGDAAFAGQGLVAETLSLSQLHGYRTGGTVHVIVNNQIGFTTSPAFSRSTAHSSDVAKMVQAPIFHVNGNDPDAVVKVMKVAADYRHQFHEDVVVDLVCYRRFGHNEADEPAFTQPLMYKAIGALPPVSAIYIDDLRRRQALSETIIEGVQKRIDKELQDHFGEASSYKPEKADWLEGQWKGLRPKNPEDEGHEPLTGVTKDKLVAIGRALATVPDTFAVHKKLLRFLEGRKGMVEKGEGIDWAMGEALAFGSLLSEGYRVRLSGQDSGRGTFTQRHAVLKDQNTEERYISLNHVIKDQGTFEVCDSPLAEFSVLGFEVGYSMSSPYTLDIWEAQFGDFANGAQVIVDQFMSSGETKWLRMSGVVMMLPHGYEGQGPEHSSARPERYLQMCAEDNMQIVNCTTPANLFHVLRRQLHREFRKPLIILTPKSLLRHKDATSSLKEFEKGTTFKSVLGETQALKNVSRVILCAGKVYYDLLAKRQEADVKDVAIIRLEQYYPFPEKFLIEELSKYPNADVVWCQEEPENMGAWTFLDRRIEKALSHVKMASSRPLYIGRPEAASPATGLMSRHQFEQNLLVSQALKLID